MLLPHPAVCVCVCVRVCVCVCVCVWVCGCVRQGILSVTLQLRGSTFLLSYHCVRACAREHQRIDSTLAQSARLHTGDNRSKSSLFD